MATFTVIGNNANYTLRLSDMSTSTRYHVFVADLNSDGTVSAYICRRSSIGSTSDWTYRGTSSSPYSQYPRPYLVRTTTAAVPYSVGGRYSYDTIISNTDPFKSGRIPAAVTPTIRYQLNYSNGTTVVYSDDYSTTSYTHTFTITSFVPSKVGYKCIGWAAVPNATVAAYHAGDSYPMRSDDPTATLYAVWQKIVISKFYWAGSDSADNNVIATGQPITNLTATRWNSLLAKIKEVAEAQGGSFTYTAVRSGETITAAKFNEARSGIAVLTGHGTLPLIQYSGNEIKASYFNGSTSLKSALNAAIEVTNG